MVVMVLVGEEALIGGITGGNTHGSMNWRTWIAHSCKQWTWTGFRTLAKNRWISRCIIYSKRHSVLPPIIRETAVLVEMLRSERQSCNDGGNGNVHGNGDSDGNGDGNGNGNGDVDVDIDINENLESRVMETVRSAQRDFSTGVFNQLRRFLYSMVVPILKRHIVVCNILDALPSFPPPLHC